MDWNDSDHIFQFNQTPDPCYGHLLFCNGNKLMRAMNSCCNNALNAAVRGAYLSDPLDA